jgi:hypothetical protein
MSDTTAFVGGAALAGLAALIFLKGGITIGAPNLSVPQSLPNIQSMPLPPAPTSVTTLPSPPSVTSSPAPVYSEKYIAETAELKEQMIQQRSQTEQLKNQLQSQQALIDALTAQSKVNALSNPPIAPYSPRYGNGLPTMADQTNNPMVSGLMWALGGMILTFGGGIALVGMFVLFSKNQRPNRTIEVVHEDYPSYLPMRRRSQMLPPRRTLRRVNAEEID